MVLPLALTMGEPAGIAGEITAKAWRTLRDSGPAFVLIGDPALLADVPVRLVEAPEQAAVASGAEAVAAPGAAMPCGA
jgi:4-hydroxythreonine-4-phosphate dehydrogenase